MGVFPSDHHIGDTAAFQQTLAQAIRLTEQTHGLITLGITPTHPAIGYGYIEQGKPAGEGYAVSRFVEKPDETTAQHYLDAGSYCWNSGMFLWHTESILGELRRYVPDLLTPLEQAHQDSCIDTVFPMLTNISIDYAVLERTERAYVLPAEFGWDDLGDWLALERHLDKCLLEEHVGVDSGGNIVYTETEDDVIVTLGVKDMVIVKRGNTVFIADKHRSQDIKKVLGHERIVKSKPTAD